MELLIGNELEVSQSQVAPPVWWDDV